MHQSKTPSPVPKRQTAIRLKPEHLERLDAYCNSHRIRLTRNRVIETAIIEFLDREQFATTRRSA